MTPPEEHPAMTDLTVRSVTVEHHREPFGIGEATPRLSWVIDTGRPGWRPRRCAIRVARTW